MMADSLEKQTRGDKKTFQRSKTFGRFITILLFALMTSILLTASQITITGQYVDKKENPIAGASVEYFSNSIKLDNAITDANGHFTLQIASVGIDDEPFPEQFHLSQNYPNPFNPETRIHCSIPSPASLTLYNIRGQLVDRI